MDVEFLYYLMLLLFGTGVLAAFLTPKNHRNTNFIAHGIATVGCLTAILCAIFVFIQGAMTLVLPISLPFGMMTVRIDNLSAYFLLVVGGVGSAVSVYALGYSREYYGQRFAAMAALYNAFLLSMVLVLTVSHAIAFVIAWELMTVVSFLLVIHDYEKPATTRAAFVYLVMTQSGTVFIIIAFLLLAATAGSMDFAQLSSHPVMDELTRNVIFLCALVGFGTKAGIIPLHIWLPKAHPAAPSHVSALMSGVMIKTAIYGLCRFYIEFLGIGPAWWGLLVLLLGILSAVLGVLYALMEHDLKRLLAYHSVENIGIILLGIGAAMVCMSKGYTVLAGMAWIAALYHVFNHALFKSLLFMGAGAVLQATHTKDIEKLGGLIKKLPYTAVFFLIGSAAISALPPLNGFVSEWLVFQALLSLPQVLEGVTGKLVGAVLIALLGLTGALAAACFVKAFGITFLAKPRSIHAENAHEASNSMLLAMGLLAGICILFGVWPQLLLTILIQTLAIFPGMDTTAFFQHEWYLVAFQSAKASGGISTQLLVLLLITGLAIASLIYRIYGTPKRLLAETWTCGIVPNTRMEYTATGFSKPIRMAFRGILRPQRETVTEQDADNRYFGRKLSYHTSIRYVFIEMLYRPANEGIIKVAKFMKLIQTGSVQLYIGYIMAATVLVLLWSARW
jgi:hydrogenase-4 component B